MNNVGIVAVDDFCRNVATDAEIARLRMALDEREKTLRTRGVPPVDPMAVTRELVAPDAC